MKSSAINLQEPVTAGIAPAGEHRPLACPVRRLAERPERRQFPEPLRKDQSACDLCAENAISGAMPIGTGAHASRMLRSASRRVASGEIARAFDFRTPKFRHSTPSDVTRAADVQSSKSPRWTPFRETRALPQAPRKTTAKFFLNNLRHPGRSASRRTGQASGLCSPEFLPLLLALFLLFICSARADDISVSAALSASSTTADQPVTLTVTVTGGMNADVPNDVQADGLDIQYQGQSRRIEMMNFRGSISVVNTFLVTPQKAGKFTIPPIEITAGGKIWRTDPLALEVTKGSTGSGQTGDATPKVYAELIIPKDTAYVGEIIPAEIRYYFAGDVQFQVNPPGQVPQIDGEGFTKQRYPQPRVEQTNINGKPYRVLIYKTAIVAAKAGELEIGPASLIFVVSMPQTNNKRRSSIFNDPFADDFFNNPLIAQRIEREMNVRSDPVKLQIKPLPAGKPAGFAGAVGQFTLAATAQPDKVKMGDPVTVKAVIGGRGNFDLVNAPTLADSTGWRTYPASGRLASENETGVAQEKNFDMAIIPEQPVKEVPPLEFSYFDPAQEKYITLHSDPIPIRVDGTAIAKATPPPSVDSGSSATPAASVTPPPKADDLAPIATVWRAQAQSFTPVWQRPGFWVAQGIPLLLILGLVGQKIAARFQPDTASLRRKKLEAESRNLRAKLSSAEAADYFPALARLLEIEAQRTGDPTEDVAASLQLDESQAALAREVFAKRDELAYGGGRGGRELSPEVRQRYESLLPAGVGR